MGSVGTHPTHGLDPLQQHPGTLFGRLRLQQLDPSALRLNGSVVGHATILLG